MKAKVRIKIEMSREFQRYVSARNWHAYLSAVSPLYLNGSTGYNWGADKTTAYTCLQSAVYETYEDIYRKLGIRPGVTHSNVRKNLAQIVAWGDACVARIKLRNEDEET